jgi:hypothetical protein
VGFLLSCLFWVERARGTAVLRRAFTKRARECPLFS